MVPTRQSNARPMPPLVTVSARAFMEKQNEKSCLFQSVVLLFRRRGGTFRFCVVVCCLFDGCCFTCASVVLFFCSLTNASEEGVDSPPAGLTPIVVSHRTPQMSATMEHEKRMRREIANSNERRRMQSINAGFQNLRTLIPHHEGEKLSKVSSSGAQFIHYNVDVLLLLFIRCLSRIINLRISHSSPISIKVQGRGVAVC